MNTLKIIRLIFFSLLVYLSIHLSHANENPLVTVQASFRTMTLSGFTRARHSMLIANEVPGKITHIYADIGQTIPENGIFACLDDTFIKLDIASTENSIAQHTTDLNYLNKQVERHKKLVQSHSAAISLLDDLIRQKENALLAIQREKIQKQKLQETKNRHCIKAPENWVITQRHIEVGQWIDIGTAVAQASDYRQLLIPLTLTTEELIALQQMQNKFNVYLPEYKQHVPATIERISPAFDEHSHKIRVDILIKDSAINHRGGIRTELSLNIPDPQNHNYLINKKALDERFEEIWLTRANGKKIQVMLQGYLNNEIAIISSPEINTGDQFKQQHP